MSRYTGMWIDHKKAVIVHSVEKKQEIVKVKSGVEGHYRLKGGSRSRTRYGPQEISSESKREGRFKHHLHEYYKRIIDMVRDSDSILVFGPGEAKQELIKEMEKDKTLAGRVAAVETTDKMTEPQIAARVRKYFASKE